MLAELCEGSKTLAARLREAHSVCEEYEDIATASPQGSPKTGQ